MNTGWYCFRCDSTPNEQLWLVNRLRSNGVPVVNPTETVYRALNKFEAAKHKKRERELSILPGYIFCRMAPWALGAFLRADKRIYGVLEVDGAPAVIPDSVVQVFTERFEDNAAPDYHKHQRSHFEFNVNDLCEFISGPLAGQVLQVLEINDDKVKVPLKILGKETQQTVSAWDLKKVG